MLRLVKEIMSKVPTRLLDNQKVLRISADAFKALHSKTKILAANVFISIYTLIVLV
jgi:hypothetical protein